MNVLSLQVVRPRPGAVVDQRELAEEIVRMVGPCVPAWPLCPFFRLLLIDARNNNRSTDFCSGKGVDCHDSIAASVGDDSAQRGPARGRAYVYGEGALQSLRFFRCMSIMDI